MKSHEQYAALLDAFIDGALSEQDAARVREHLADCPECRSYVSDALVMRELFPGIEETPVPDGFADAVMSALPAQRIPWRRQWKKAALPLAACIAIALLLRGLYVLPMGATGGAAPDMGGGAVAEESAQASLYGDFAEYEESASEDADEFEMTAVTSDMGAASGAGAPDSAAAQAETNGAANASATGGAASKSMPNSSAAQDTPDGGVTFNSAAAEVSESQSAASRYSAQRSDDADAMPPQTPEPSKAEKGASLRSAPQDDNASLKSASQGADAGASQDDIAPLGVSYAPVVSASGATETEAPAQTEAEAVVTEAAPEFADASDDESLSVSVWTLSADAAPIMERYPPDAVTPEGVWYALTLSEFDDLCERFPDIEITSGPETMNADSLPDDAPPLTYVDAVYLFVPNP